MVADGREGAVDGAVMLRVDDRVRCRVMLSDHNRDDGERFRCRIEDAHEYMDYMPSHDGAMEGRNGMCLGMVTSKSSVLCASRQLVPAQPVAKSSKAVRC